jgi:hypothetical protein
MKQIKSSQEGAKLSVVVMVLSAMMLHSPVTTSGFQARPLPAFTQQQKCLLYSTTNEDSPQHNKRGKTTKGFTINPNLVGSISSDGVLTDRRKDQPARVSSTSLGKPTKPKKEKSTTANNKMSKKDRQRTANGAVDSSLQTLIADPENEMIQVLQAKRGNKTVTIVRYV